MTRGLFGALIAVVAVAGVWTVVGFGLWAADAPVDPVMVRVRAADRVIHMRARFDSPAHFKLHGAERHLKLITHGVSDSATATSGRLRYALDLTLRDRQGAKLYAVRLHTASRLGRSIREGGTPNAFLLDDPRPVFDDRVIRFELPIDVPPEAVLEVRSSQPGVEVLVRAYARQVNDAVGRRAFDFWSSAGGRAWRWARRAGLGATRVVYYTGERASFEPHRALEPLHLDVDRAIALQVQGPVTLGVRIARPVGSTAQTVRLTSSGAVKARELLLPAAPGALHQATVEIPAGVHGLQLRSDGPTRLQVDAPAGQRAQFGDVPVVAWKDRELLRPDERALRVFEVHAGRSIRFEIEAEQSDLRLKVRPLDSVDERRLTVRLLDGGGRALKTFNQGFQAPRAPFERIERPDGRVGAVGEPVVLHVPLTPATRAVEITADRATGVQGEVFMPAPPEAPRLAAPYADVYGPSLTWRYAPLLSHDWHAVLPVEHDAVVQAGAELRLVAQARLERRAPAEPRPRPMRFRSVPPLGRPLSQLIVERPSEARRQQLRGLWPANALSELRLDRPFQTRGATVLRWWLPRATPAGHLVLQSDQGLRRLPLGSSAGGVRLAPSAAPRRLAIAGATTRPRIFVDRPVSGAPTLLRRRIHRLTSRGLTVAVQHRAGTRRILNVVIYASGREADPTVRLVTRIDDGVPRRQTGLAARRPSPGVQRFTLPAAQSDDRPVLLDIDGRTVGPPRTIPIVIGPDLADGEHRVHIAAEGGRRLWARFFEAGAPRRRRVDWHWRRREAR